MFLLLNHYSYFQFVSWFPVYPYNKYMSFLQQLEQIVIHNSAATVESLMKELFY